MSKTSFMEGKAEKLAQKQRYHASYLKAYEYQLKQENDPEIEILLSDKKEAFDKKEKRFMEKAKKQDYRHKKRVWEIDALRAFIIFCMLFEHLFYDFYGLFPTIFDYSAYDAIPFFHSMTSFASAYWIHPARIATRLLGLVALGFLIGINTRFSRNNLKRGLILIGCGLAMCGVFAVVGQFGFNVEPPFMNVLVCYGLSLLIFSGIEAFFKRYTKYWPWICLGIALVILVSWGFIRYAKANMMQGISESNNNFWFIYHGYIESIPRVDDLKEASFGDILKVIIGINYYGEDWLGLLPNLGYVFFGAFVGHTVYRNGLSVLHYFDKEGHMTLNEKFNCSTKGFLFFGHHTLWIYLIHQVVYIILFLFVGAVILGLPLGV